MTGLRIRPQHARIFLMVLGAAALLVFGSQIGNQGGEIDQAQERAAIIAEATKITERGRAEACRYDNAQQKILVALLRDRGVPAKFEASSCLTYKDTGRIVFPEASPPRLGKQGIPGTPGSPGIPGLQGGEGTPGLPGATGAVGPVGPQGAGGDTGATGAEGSAGAGGDTGSQGARGEKGETGPQGPQGEQGPAGPVGPTGPQGPPGEQGPPGGLLP